MKKFNLNSFYIDNKIENKNCSIEQLLQPVTLERWKEWENNIGEMFIDQNSHLLSHLPIAGYFMAKYPEHATEIIDEVINNKFGEVLGLKDIIEGDDEEKYEEFIQHLCDYINLTTNTKARVNYHLINQE